MNHKTNFRHAPASLSRRQFIHQTAAVGALVGSSLAPLTHRTVAASGTPPWRITCRDQHLRITAQSDCWAAMKFLQVDGVEVVVNENLTCPSLYHPERRYTLATDEGLAQLREDFQQHGRAISALCLSNHLDERMDEDVTWTTKVVRAAEQLKVAAVRLDVVPRRTPPAQFLPVAIKACQALCTATAGSPVCFGIENHGRMTNDPEFLGKLFDAVGSPRLGLTLDIMNFYWFGHPLPDIYRITEKFAGRVFHTHCKNLRYPEDRRTTRRPMGWEYEKCAAPVYDGDIDYRRVVAILRRAGYRGDLCLENECLGHYPKAQQSEVLRKEIAFLKQVSSP